MVLLYMHTYLRKTKGNVAFCQLKTNAARCCYFAAFVLSFFSHDEGLCYVFLTRNNRSLFLASNGVNFQNAYLFVYSFIYFQNVSLWCLIYSIFHKCWWSCVSSLQNPMIEPSYLKKFIFRETNFFVDHQWPIFLLSPLIYIYIYIYQS